MQKKKRKPKKPRTVDPNPINPNFLYRWADGPRFFGFRPTVLSEKIASGDVPWPIRLSDGGRARGWLGQQILDWQKARVEKAKEEQQRWMEEKEKPGATAEVEMP